MRRIDLPNPVEGNTCAKGVACATGAWRCGGTGLSTRLPAIVPPITVMDANVLSFMNSPRVAYNLTAIRCDADFERAAVSEP